jgi:hypothetical protein
MVGGAAFTGRTKGDFGAEEVAPVTSRAQAAIKASLRLDLGFVAMKARSHLLETFHPLAWLQTGNGFPRKVFEEERFKVTERDNPPEIPAGPRPEKSMNGKGSSSSHDHSICLFERMPQAPQMNGESSPLAG